MEAFARQAPLPARGGLSREEMLQMQMHQWTQQQQMANAASPNSVLGQQLGELLLEAEDPNKEPEDDDQPAAPRRLTPRNIYRGFQGQKQAPPSSHLGFHHGQQKHHNRQFDKTVVHHRGDLKMSNQNGIPSHGNDVFIVIFYIFQILKFSIYFFLNT